MNSANEELKLYVAKDVENLRRLNFSEAYIKSVALNTKKWASFGLLQGISDPFIGRNLASLYENQFLHNEKWPGNQSLLPEGVESLIPLTDWIQLWKRASIPVLRRCFDNNFIGYDLVSVQTIKSPEENLYLLDFNGRLYSVLIQSSSRILRSKWHGPDNEQHLNSLDAEAASIEVFAQNLSNEFNREIISDLAQAAGKSVRYEYVDETHLVELLEGLSAYIGAKCYVKDATWVVTSPQIVSLLAEFIDFDESIKMGQRQGVNLIGVLHNKWKIYEDSSAYKGDILMGLKDVRSHYFSGYIFSPYLPATPTPFWKKEDIVSDNSGYVTARYGKRLTNPSFYGTIRMENLPQVTPINEVINVEEPRENTQDVVEGG